MANYVVFVSCAKKNKLYLLFFLILLFLKGNRNETKNVHRQKKRTACYEYSDVFIVQAKDTSSLFHPVFLNKKLISSANLRPALTLIRITKDEKVLAFFKGLLL
jgi:hypothetical protein